jgi:Tfp pilus assembly protein PilF
MERRRVVTLGSLAAAIAFSLVIFGRSPKEASARRTPTDPNEVLETLPGAVNGQPDPRRREEVTLRNVLAANPENLPAAVRLARLDIQLARERSDPRYLGRAQAVLQPWWKDEAPAVVLVLRATIEQSLHDFPSALTHLDLALKQAPGDPQAWLTRAVILTVTAHYDEAHESCAKVKPLADEIAFAVCDTEIDSVLGKAKPAYERLTNVLAHSHSTEDEYEWATSSLGEYAWRFGDAAAAEKHFSEALKLAPDDAYVRGTYADLLTDLKRYDEAIALVKDHEADDALLLRLAVAEHRAKKRDAARHIEMLGARFDASRERGDVVHRREEARYWLELKDDAARAYPLAKANWDVQKEPWDARIFLAAAKAAHEPATAAEEHIEKTGLEGQGISR